MKRLSAITLAALVAVSTSAFGATTKKKMKLLSNDSSSTTTAAVLPGTSASAGSPSAQATSSTGSISAPIPTAAEKKWSIDLYAEDYWDVEKAEHQAGQMNTAEFIGYNYKLTDNTKLYIRQNFSADVDPDSSKSHSQGSFSRIDDTELGMVNSKLATWANEGSLTLYNRFYLPTGKYSQRQNKLMALREILVASQPLNKTWEVGAVLDSRYYAVGKAAYVNDNGQTKKTNDVMSYQYDYVTAKANDNLSASVDLGTMNALRHQSNNRLAITYLDINATAQLTKQIALTLGTENDADISGAKKRSHAFLRPDETQYYMNMIASM